MKLLEFIPLSAFLVAYLITKDLFVATEYLLISSVIFYPLLWWWRKKLDKMSLFSFVAIVFFSALTLLFREKLFIQLKPTIVNYSFACLIGVFLLLKKNPIKAIMGNLIQLQESQWTSFAIYWLIFFVVAGSANLFVWSFFSEEVWVQFRYFGLMGISLAFALFQGVMIYRWQKNP